MVSTGGVLNNSTAPEVVVYGQITTPATTTPEEPIATEPVIVTEEGIVRSYFEDLPIMVQIAECESNFNHTRSDGSVLRGRIDDDDIGVMQINRRYHGESADKMELDLNDIYDNMTYARVLYNESGTRPWNPSAHCWDKTLAKA